MYEVQRGWGKKCDFCVCNYMDVPSVKAVDGLFLFTVALLQHSACGLAPPKLTIAGKPQAVNKPLFQSRLICVNLSCVFSKMNFVCTVFVILA